MREKKDKFVNNGGIYYIIGAICIMIYFLPHMILGQDASFRIVDFLDDELIQFLYNGKYFFKPADTVVEEWLSGAPMYSIQPPCFTLIWFFSLFDYYHAVIACSVFGVVFAFLGMFLLCDKIFKGQYRIISLVVSVLFFMLPFYPSYGLSSIGIPLAVWALWNLTEKKEKNHQYILYYAVVIFYALSSSLVWAGYFMVGFTFIFSIVLFLRKEKKPACRILAAVGIMTLVYCIVFRSSILQMLFEPGASHRNDPSRIWEARNFWTSFVEMFKYGQYHAPSVHTYIMAFSLGVIFLGIIFYRKMTQNDKRWFKIAVFLWLSAFAIALFYAFYHSQIGLDLREVLGSLKSFQLDRIYWLNPTIWYTELAVASVLFINIMGILIPWNKLLLLCKVFFVFVMATFSAHHILTHIDSVEYFSSVKSIFTGESSQITYRDFYDHEVFEEIADYIGRDQSEYRVASLGIVPAVAQANGFYTVDAYSTNYPLEYKYEFRKVIEKELEKNDEIRIYYDNWGGRCYLYSAELGIDFRFGKDENVVIEQLELNTEVLAELGCEYIFSSVKVGNAEENHLRLLEVFTRENGWMEVYLYEIVDEE